MCNSDVLHIGGFSDSFMIQYSHIRKSDLYAFANLS